MIVQSGLEFTVTDVLSLHVQPFASVMLTSIEIEPVEPASNVIEVVPCPPVSVPSPVTLQVIVYGPVVFGFTEAVCPVVPAHTADGAVIVQSGLGSTDMPTALLHVHVSSPIWRMMSMRSVTEPTAVPVNVIEFVPWPLSMLRFPVPAITDQR